MQKISDDKNKNKVRRKSIQEQEENINRLKELFIKHRRGSVSTKKNDLFHNVIPQLNLEAIDYFTKKSKSEVLHKLLNILSSHPMERKAEEENFLLNFLLNTKISEVLKSDTLVTDFQIQDLFKYFKPYIFGKCYNFMDTIFSNGQESDIIYVVLNGSVGQYKLEVYEEELTAEEYYTFIADCYTLYEEEMHMGKLYTLKEEPKKDYRIRIKSYFGSNISSIQQQSSSYNKKVEVNKNEKEYDDSSEDENEDSLEQYIDHYLICQMIEENKDIFPLMEISDLVRLKKIIFKLRLYATLNDLGQRDAQLLYMTYEFPETYLNFDKVLNCTITISKYLEILSFNFKLIDYFYMKLLGPLKHKVKLMKYVKRSKNFEPYSIFGNYELIDFESRRDLTTRCESEKCVLLCINKKMYSQDLYNAQKTRRDKEVDIMYSLYLFNSLSKNYFHRKIFSQFKIDNYFKDNIIFRQNQKIKSFFFIKEGILELSLQNISFLEFHKLIERIKEAIISKSKEAKINIKKFFDFDTNVDSKTHYSMNILRDILNQKQNFIFQRNEKGIFGDFELYFELPLLLTATVVSDKCLLYSYDYRKFRNLSNEAYILNDSLKENAFTKIKTLLKRMIMVYNSYWRLSMEQLGKSLKEKDKNIEDIDFNKNTIKKSGFHARNRINMNLLTEIQSYNQNEPNNLQLYKSLSKKNTMLRNQLHQSTKRLITNNHIEKSKSRKKIKMEYDFLESIINPKDKIQNLKVMKNSKNINRNSNLIQENLITKEEDKLNNNNHLGNEKYQKKLMNELIQSMEGRISAQKKEKSKIFLPPINKMVNFQAQTTLDESNNMNDIQKRELKCKKFGKNSMKIVKRPKNKSKENVLTNPNVVQISFSDRNQDNDNINETERMNKYNIKDNFDFSKDKLKKKSKFGRNNLKLVQLSNLQNRYTGKNKLEERSYESFD